MFTKMVLSIMKKTKFFLERWGLHSFFLLLFFVLHNYNQYYGMVSAKVAFSVFLQILLIFSVCFLLLFFFIRDINKSLLLITLIGAIVLFFGVIKDFFQTTLN